MKTKVFFRNTAIIVLAVMFASTINAQITHPTSLVITGNQIVNINSTFHYGVDSVERAGVSNTYTWTVGGGVAGINYQITPAGNKSQKTIKWLIAGPYTIDLTEQNPAGFGPCPVNATTLNVTVNAVATGNVVFASATGTNQCSAAGADSISLTTTGTISYPITVAVQYTINSATSTGNIIVTNPAMRLGIPAGVNFLTSLTDDAARSVHITGVTDSHAGVLGIVGVTTQTLTIWAVPALTTIQHD